MPEPHQPKAIHSRAFWRALVDAGIFSEGERVTRIIIDVQVDRAVMLYVERYGDERLLSLVQTLEGAEIHGVPAEGGIQDLAEAVHQELLKRKRNQGGTALGLA